MKKAISLLIIISLLLIICVSSYSAEQIHSYIDNNPKWQTKLDTALFEKISAINDNEIIKVWVWFKDIDYRKAENTIEALTDISREKYYAKSIKIDFNSVNPIDTVTSKEFQSTMGKKNTDNYQKTRMKVYNEMYLENNEYILNELHISNDSVIYLCNMTPSAIINMTKKELIDIADSEYITALYYYDESNNDTAFTNKDNNQNSMHLYDKDSLHYTDTIGEYDPTGVSMNTLVIGGFEGYVYYSENILNPNTVYNYYNNSAHCITNGDPLPFGCDFSNHATYVVEVLKDYAPDTLVYAVKPSDFNSIRSVINSGQLDYICVAFGYGEHSHEYGPYSKWFDIVSSRFDITVVSSAGVPLTNNFYYSSVYSVAKGYNSIAVGAFTAKENMSEEKMKNSPYNPTYFNQIPSFKPDVILPTYDTSSASPTLTGLLACATEINPDIRRIPEVQKAVAMASCHRKILPYSDDLQETMEQGLTLKQGSGVVDAYRLFKIAEYGTFDYTTLYANNSIFETILLPFENVDFDGSIKYNNKVNTSLVWQRTGILGVEPTTNDTTVDPLQELKLDILDDSNVVASSNAVNSCKQMAYYVNGESEHTYTVRITNTNDPGTIQNIFFAYAWSEKGTKELISVSINGFAMSGQTLAATVIDSNNSHPNCRNNFEYHWQRSSDGSTWSSDIGNDETYLLSSLDIGQYIKCTITPLDTSLYTDQSVESVTNTKIVLCGDINLDGSVTLSDVSLLQQYLAYIPIIELNNEQLLAADTYLDGEIDSIDVIILQRYIYGMIQSLPSLGE